PDSANLLVSSLKEKTGLPIHFHTHDTSGIAAASVISAVRAGADAVDLAMDAVSGTTSQPNLGSVVRALKGTQFDSGLDSDAILELSSYWEGVRKNYAAFESDVRFGASEVYLHEMPGGQFTNLKEQARALGLETRWHEVAQAYSVVNDMLGDVIKVTPTSKMVGDMALFMVSSGLSREDVEDPNREVAFPDSVKSFFAGELGQPYGGFPADLQKKVLKGETPITNRPGENLPPADLDELRSEAESKVEGAISNEEFQSYLMYPAVFLEYMSHRRQNGPMHVLPTPVFFYGMKPEQEISVDLEPGKTLVIQCLAIGETDADGNIRVFFELNGQPRTVKVPNRKVANLVEQRRKGEEGNPDHVISPMPGMISSVNASVGQLIEAGDVILTIEAMKMETAIRAERSANVASLLVSVGDNVDAKDLLVEFSSAK
ncbi:MAG: pyruvate carboxylase, partial [Gammaproteobacteria bacterium]|nr:pyruvate carboxylase [Gammaproteobacteria bacterium]